MEIFTTTEDKRRVKPELGLAPLTRHVRDRLRVSA